MRQKDYHLGGIQVILRIKPKSTIVQLNCPLGAIQVIFGIFKVELLQLSYVISEIPKIKILWN